MTITYYDEILMIDKKETRLTEAEMQSRLCDLTMMELGGKISDIKVTEES